MTVVASLPAEKTKIMAFITNFTSFAVKFNMPMLFHYLDQLKITAGQH